MEINLKGLIVLIDDEDYEKIKEYKWFYGKRKDGRVYFNAIIKNGFNEKTKKQSYKSISLHRLIIGCPKGLVVDHIDGNTLNNRKSNLRSCTWRNNAQNRKCYENNKSGCKGVYKSNKKWGANIRLEEGILYLGVFDTKKEAHNAYCNAASKYFVEFARSE